jgi:BirA family transcriptional regulator, biotin operon repressor / biotin---[acetyl-CoA-carboxylase] ligase
MQHHWPIINLKQVDSTNNYARQLIEKHELTRETVINTQFQLKGKGQQDNSWESERGKNLTFSLVLFTPCLKADKQFFLAQAVSLAISDFLKLHSINSKIKWPNDIYSGNKKIAGILIENAVLNDSITHSIIGIGVNVNQQLFGNKLLNVQSMKNITSLNYSLKGLLDQLLVCIEKQVNRIKNKNFTDVKKDYTGKLYRFEKESRFSAKGETFSGKIVEVDESGRLCILNDKGKKLSFMFKEVQFLD